jgi:GNAT superfamily N-acetyltransferase
MFGLRSVMLRQLLLSYLLLVVAGTLRAEANTGSLIHQTEPRLPRLGRPGPPAFSRPGRFEVHELLVAQDDGGSVVGWVHTHVPRLLQTERTAQVWGLVVDEARRGSGAGQLLMAEVERWAAK